MNMEKPIYVCMDSPHNDCIDLIDPIDGFWEFSKALQMLVEQQAIIAKFLFLSCYTLLVDGFKQQKN